jgi:hypothetical protein
MRSISRERLVDADVQTAALRRLLSCHEQLVYVTQKVKRPRNALRFWGDCGATQADARGARVRGRSRLTVRSHGLRWSSHDRQLLGVRATGRPLRARRFRRLCVVAGCRARALHDPWAPASRRSHTGRFDLHPVIGRLRALDERPLTRRLARFIPRTLIRNGVRFFSPPPPTLLNIPEALEVSRRQWQGYRPGGGGDGYRPRRDIQRREPVPGFRSGR